ncbi:MAG TPA: protein kinase, partial [Pirellulales bacterium]|nr:protein kinase [Pirellulales bacterium]
MNEATHAANDASASRLEAAVETYAAQLRAGSHPDREAFVAAHPEIATELRRRLVLVDIAGSHLDAPPRERSGSLGVEPNPAQLDGADQRPVQIGKFEILDRLGHGSFGTVYKARDPQLHRLVAIKVPRAGTFQAPENQERFLREARSAAALKHPGIVQVYEIAHERGVPFIVSEFICGRNLGELLATARPGFTQAAELVAQVADALDYAHGRRIIHRDVKPANILIDEAGLAHVADFGLARRDEGEVTVTVEGQMLGTPAYMSPEQAAGNHAQVDGRSDVYSLGVVLYELLTGERPFRGQVRMLLQQVIDEDPRPPRSLNDRVPRDLEKVCLMSLAKSKGRRYATAGEFAADLRRWLRGEGVLARPAGRLERARRWCRRNPAVAGLACAVVAALVAGTAVSWRFAIIAGQRAEEAVKSAQRAKEQETKAIENALVARRQSYVAGLAATRYHLERGEVEPAKRVLAESNPTSAGEQDLRGFEWRYLWRQSHAALASRDLYAERGQSVSGFEFSPDGQSLYITFSSNDPSDAAKFVEGYTQWDLETDELVDPPAHLAETLRGPLAISSDGRYLAGRLADGFLSLFDAQSGRQLAHLDEQAHGQMTQGQVFSLAFSPDGHALAGLHGYWQNLTALVWDVPQGTCRGEAAAGQQLRFSADGGLLATWGDSKPLELLSPKSVESRGKLSLLPAAAALSPDGKLLAAATGDRETPGEIKLWNVETLTEAVTLRNSHLAGVTAMVFSPDGQRIATASHDATIKFFRTETGDELATITTGGAAIDRLVFSPNGELLAGGAGSLVQVWDGTLGSQRSPLDGERFQWVCAAFADDRRTLAVGGVERRFGKETCQVRLWDLASQSLRATIGPFARRVWAVAFSRDGTMLAVGGGDWLPPGRETNGFAKIFDPVTGGELLSIPAELPLVTLLDFSSDGRMLAVGGGGVTLWNVPAATRRAALPGQSNWIYAIDLADDDTRLAAGCQNGELVIWDVTTNESRVSSERHDNCVFDVAFSPDGRNVATAGWDKVAWLWDAETLRQISGYTGHSGELFSIGFSPDGTRFVTSSRDSTIRWWDAQNGDELRKLDLPPDGNWSDVHFAVLSPDGAALAATYDRNMVRLWDTASWQAVGALSEGHTGGVGAIAFAPPDGAQFATAGWDGTIQFWDSATGHYLAGLAADDPRDGTGETPRLAFSPDGATLASVGTDKSVKLWDVAARRQTAMFRAGDDHVNSIVFAGDDVLVIAITAAQQQHGDRPLQEAKRARSLVGRQLIQLWGSLALVVSRDGGLLAASGPSGVTIWDAKTWLPKCKLALDEAAWRTNVAAFSPNGRTLATIGRSATLWDVMTGTKQRELAMPGVVACATFSPDGHTLATAGQDKAIRLWSVDTGQQLVSLEGHSQFIQSLGFSPRGDLLVSGGVEYSKFIVDCTLPAEIKLWRAATLDDVADDERQAAERKRSNERRWQERQDRQEAANRRRAEERSSQRPRRTEITKSSW